METITGGSLLLQFIVIVALTGINAFFSSAEMAIVSLNKNKLKILIEDGNKKAILLDNLLKEPSKFLSTIQVGITLASFFASASAATGLSQFLSVFLNKYNICVRSGNHCSKLLKDFILTSNTCRVSLNIYNTKEDILKLVEVLNKQEEIYENII